MAQRQFRPRSRRGQVFFVVRRVLQNLLKVTQPLPAETHVAQAFAQTAVEQTEELAASAAHFLLQTLASVQRQVVEENADQPPRRATAEEAEAAPARGAL